MPTIDLVEYEPWAGTIDGPELAALANVAGTRLDVSRDLDGRARIVAKEHVGVFVASDVVVRVRPKVNLDNLFYLLGVGDESWTIDAALGPFGERESDDLVVAVVRLFAREVERLSARGLLHGYVSHEERLLALRGRVDINALIRRPWERTPVACRFDEFVPDIWVNQVLLAALTTARRGPMLPPRLRAELHVLQQRFDGVRQPTIDLDQLARWRGNRRDRHYTVALRLAEVVLRLISLADVDGDCHAAAFTLDMNKLFEEFVGRELAQRLPADLELTEQYWTSLDRSGRLRMAPDLVVHPRGDRDRPVFVGDVKYKLTDSLGVNSDHYQLLAYATVFGLGEGVLVYCQRGDHDLAGTGEAPTTTVTVRGAGIEHTVYRLDVSGTRADIDRRLDDLAAWLISRIRGPEAAGRRPAAVHAVTAPDLGSGAALSEAV